MYPRAARRRGLRAIHVSETHPGGISGNHARIVGRSGNRPGNYVSDGYKLLDCRFVGSGEKADTVRACGWGRRWPRTGGGTSCPETEQPSRRFTSRHMNRTGCAPIWDTAQRVDAPCASPNVGTGMGLCAARLDGAGTPRGMRLDVPTTLPDDQRAPGP